MQAFPHLEAERAADRPAHTSWMGSKIVPFASCMAVALFALNTVEEPWLKPLGVAASLRRAWKARLPGLKVRGFHQVGTRLKRALTEWSP
jgi:hypothetical protein